MKISPLSLVLFALMASPSLWGQRAEGGQSGSGGNGCWVRATRPSTSSSSMELKWMSLEELAYPELIKKDDIESKRIIFPASSSKHGALSSFNLWRTTGSKAFKRFEHLQATAPHFYALMAEMSQLFKHSYVLNMKIDGVYASDRIRKFPKCMAFSPALLTLKDGTIIFFKPVWNRLDSLTTEIILVHETIRMAQVFHPAFRNFSNTDLERLTALLFSRPLLTSEIGPILEDVETKLAQRDYPIEVPTSMPSEAENIYTQLRFNFLFQVTLESGRSLGQELNELRIREEKFRRAVESNIRAKFTGPN